MTRGAPARDRVGGESVQCGKGSATAHELAVYQELICTITDLPSIMHLSVQAYAVAADEKRAADENGRRGRSTRALLISRALAARCGNQHEYPLLIGQLLIYKPAKSPRCTYREKAVEVGCALLVHIVTNIDTTACFV